MNCINKLLTIAVIVVLAACSSLPTGYDKKFSYAVTDTAHTTLGKKAAEMLGENTDQSVVYIVNEGTDAFFARMLLLAQAERSIDVQYFIWHADLIGKLLFNEMIIAADRGVRVRILLDDININTEVEAMLYAMDQHKNIEVHLYNPFSSRGFRAADFATDTFRINRRMHNKSLSSTDGIMAQSGYARHRVALLKGGIELYELRADRKTEASRSLRHSAKEKSGLHSKTYIFDREEVFIGSFNFDQRSANINAEVGIVYKIPAMAKLIASRVFDNAVNDFAYRVELDVKHGQDEDGMDEVTETVVWVETRDGKEYRYTTQPGTSGWRRFNEGVFSILPIESQL